MCVGYPPPSAVVDDFVKYGFVTLEDTDIAASLTLEDAFNHAAVGNAARVLGRTDIETLFGEYG